MKRIYIHKPEHHTDRATEHVVSTTAEVFHRSSPSKHMEDIGKQCTV